MTIGRVRIEGGFSVRRDDRFIDKIINKATDDNLKVEILPEGTYDVTPPLPAETFYRHELVVFGNGGGLYRLFPKEVDAISVMVGEDRVMQSGGRQVNIPKDSGVMVISTRDPQCEGNMLVHGILVHKPGMSPRRRL